MSVSAVLVFSRGVKVIGERLNPFNDPAIVAEGFPTPPALVITDDAGVTRYYDAQGKVVFVRQPFRLVEAIRADLAAAEAERAAQEPAAAQPAPAAATVAPATKEEAMIEFVVSVAAVIGAGVGAVALRRWWQGVAGGTRWYWVLMGPLAVVLALAFLAGVGLLEIAGDDGDIGGPG